MPPLLSIFAGPVFFEFDFDWKPPKRKTDREWEGVGREREREAKNLFPPCGISIFRCSFGMFHIWQLFSFRLFRFFVIRCMQMRSLICFGIDSLLKTSSECHRKLETESHLTRRGRACQSTEMLISWLLQVRIWIRIRNRVEALCVTATVVRFSSFQFPFEFNQINYVCQWIEASAFRTLINGHFGLIELLQKNWKEVDMTSWYESLDYSIFYGSTGF